MATADRKEEKGHEECALVPFDYDPPNRLTVGELRLAAPGGTRPARLRSVEASIDHIRRSPGAERPVGLRAGAFGVAGNGATGTR